MLLRLLGASLPVISVWAALRGRLVTLLVILEGCNYQPKGRPGSAPYNFTALLPDADLRQGRRMPDNRN